jgi:hypothetical protein
MHGAMPTLRPSGPAAGLAAIAGLAAALGLYCWLVLTPPVNSCSDRAPRAAVLAYRHAAVVPHLLALLVLGAIVVAMSRPRTGHTGRPTAVALALAGLLTLLAYFDHDVFALLAVPGLLALVFVAPVAVLAAVVAAAWAARRRSVHPSPLFTSWVAWIAIGLVPGHLALVLLQGEPLFCF